MKTITLANLERTAKNWDKQTKRILIAVEGGGNMFGGWNKMVAITLHGENSITETGTITIDGIATSSYNIARGANGDNSGHLAYYKGVTSFENRPEPDFEFNMKGTCATGEETLASLISAEKDYYID